MALVTGMIAFSEKSVIAAEELSVLSFDEHLIAEIDVDASLTDTEILYAYYQLLPRSTSALLADYVKTMDTLLVNYEIAFTAADSAEVTQVISDMNMQWIKIQEVHREAFTASACLLLDKIYGRLYSL